MQIYNSLTKKIEEFKTINKRVVDMYVCGPTVYNHIHIGNARPLVFFDTLKNILEFEGYKVLYASNITDVDDRIIKASLKKGIDEKTFAGYYIKKYFALYKKLNARIPDFTPYATEYIEKMVKFIDDLIKTDYAYIRPSGVYFKVHKVKNFGILSNRKLEDATSGYRVNVKDDKEESEDFALWKFSTSDSDEGITFDAPFGKGRPGWHTECVCMSDSIFNGNIDIHGGGIDLIFPHHENEIAQKEAHDHVMLANYWVHVNFLNMGDVKMSKSLGNIKYAYKAIKEYGGLAVRLFLLSTNYRTPITYSDASLQNAKEKIEHIYRLIRTKILLLKSSEGTIKLGISKRELRQDELFAAFIKELNDDVNTANAISILYEYVKKLANRNITTDTLKNLKVLIQMLKILGLYKKQIINKDVISLYNDYLDYKTKKLYDKSDEIRNKLISMGYTV